MKRNKTSRQAKVLDKIEAMKELNRKTRINLTIRQGLINELSEFCEQKGIPISQLVEGLIASFLEDES